MILYLFTIHAGDGDGVSDAVSDGVTGNGMGGIVGFLSTFFDVASSLHI